MGTQSWTIIITLCLLPLLLPLPPSSATRPLKTPSKRYAKFDLYVATGPDDWTVGANDTLVIFTVMPYKNRVRKRWSVDLKSVGNEPHHLTFTRDRRFLIFGGLLSFASGLPSLYFFRTSPSKPPVLFKSETPANSTCADWGVPTPDGGLIFSMMGGPGGGEGGQLVKYDKDVNYVTQFPPDAMEYLNKTGHAFQPHGVIVSNDGRYIFSADFITPITTIPAYSPIKRWGTLRLFDGKSLELIRTYEAPTDSPNSMGLMDVTWVRDKAVAACTATGKLYCGDPNIPGLLVSFDFNDIDAQPQIVITNKEQTIVYTATYKQGIVYKLDAKDPCNLKLIKKTELPADAGPHSLILSPNGKLLIVTGYFLDEKNVGGLVRSSGDMQMRFFRTSTLIEIESMRVDFRTAIKPNVIYRPHGMAVMAR